LDKYKNAKAVIFRETGTKTPPEKEEIIELDIAVAEINTIKGWRRSLKKAIESSGEKIKAINTLHIPMYECHVAIILFKKEPFVRKRPVTRGGNRIEGPLKVRTMASKRRSK